MSNKSKINYHPNFIKYMNEIINNENYKGLPIKYKKDNMPAWVATKSSKIGSKRREWADKKAILFGFENSKKKYAETMFKIHPTKKKVCQCCGRTMDLHYIYPSKNTVKYLSKHFNYIYDKYDSIYDVIKQLPTFNDEIKEYLIKKANLNKEFENKNINKVIEAVELRCRKSGKRILSPGAMSDFPDRFDGFHSYNLCCRKEKDKGRHDNNMATYTSDRRAYEYWSDGNIAAANEIMSNKSIFPGKSADHIGPISLGFKHDPNFLQPMSTSDNSSKRDKLNANDMDALIDIENKTNVCPASSFSKIIWQFIKIDYLNDERKFNFSWYRHILKQNMSNFMESVWLLLNTKDKNNVENFLDKRYFKPKYTKYFKYRYSFDHYGKLIKKTKRNFTDSSKNELLRIKRISFKSVYSFHVKSLDNRVTKPDLSDIEKNKIKNIQEKIKNNYSMKNIIVEWNDYIEFMQKELISNWVE